MSTRSCARWAVWRPVRPAKSLLYSTLTILLFAHPCYLSAQTHPSPSADEQFFFDAVNRERVTHQLQPLKWDEALAEAARKHAVLMSEQGDLSHHLPGEAPLDQRAAHAGARFSQVGENIATGRHPQEIHTGWMH